jgi:pyruvate/2-oxoglutarate dehydrogenase complex dihydrolipoamide dehydrogenase (E3) component
MSKHYDIIVIGAGAGGLSTAMNAHRRGAKVAMLEKDKIGGECTHSGCVPSKAFLHAAHTFHAVQGLSSLGLSEMRPVSDFHFGNVMEHVNDIIQSIYEHERPEVFQEMGLDTIVHPSGARFVDRNTVEIGDEQLTAEHFVISTGSKPRMIDIVGHNPLNFLNNENFWNIREQAPAMVFLGGGVIAAELGQAMARLGCEVTIIDRNARILKALDEEVGELATTLLQNEGINIITDSEITACEQLGPDETKIFMDHNGQQVELNASKIFVALGRQPRVSALALEKAGVAYDAVGGIQTNEYLQTTAPNIYACGDVTTRMRLTHVANFQAIVCLDNIMEGNHRTNDLSLVPWTIFIEPEVSHVGLSEAQARKQLGDDVQVARFEAEKMDRFITDASTTGFLKIIMDGDHRILGADALGARSGEWIQLITLAIQNKMCAQDFAHTTFTYPSYAEIVKKALVSHLQSKS